jgi:hypothetical protein
VAFVGVQRLKMPELLEFRRALGRGAGARSAESFDLDALARPLRALERALEDYTDITAAEIVAMTNYMHADLVIWDWQRGQARSDGGEASELRFPLIDGDEGAAWMTVRQPWPGADGWSFESLSDVVVSDRIDAVADACAVAFAQERSSGAPSERREADVVGVFQAADS